MSPIDWFSALEATAALIALALIARGQLGSWLAPSVVFAAYWGAAQLSLLAFAGDMDYRPSAAWFVLALGLAIHFGALLGAAVLASPRRALGVTVGAKVLPYDLFKGSLIISVLGGCGLLVAYLLVQNAGFTVLSLLDPANILAVGYQYVGARYELGGGPPTEVNALNSLMYVGAMLAGLWAGMRPGWRTTVFVALPLAAGLMQAVLVMARTGFVWLVIFTVSGYLAGAVLSRRDSRLLSPRRVLLAISLVPALIVFIYLLQTVRQGDPLFDSPISVSKTRIGTFGSPIAFSIWFDSHWADIEPAWGAKTLGGPFSLLGLASRSQALGWEPVLALPPDESSGTNVFTGFRQLLEDFSLPGALALALLAGFLSECAYIMIGRGHTRWVPLLTLNYVVLFSSYIANPLYYNTCFFAWLAVFFLLVGLGPWLVRASRPARGGTPAIGGTRNPTSRWIGQRLHAGNLGAK